ncbi:MAG: flagellar hook assembly protein FlgD [Hyphomonadaceae bacterium]
MSSSFDAINAANTSALANANASNTTSTASAEQTLAGNFNTFLTLLTAQLQNQDPLSPMDSNQFTQQLVQFSSVEQQIKTNQNLESMLAQSKAAAAGTALSYLGRDAVLNSDTAALQNGAVAWTYSLPNESSATKIEVRDARGVTLYTANGETGAGAHLFTWNGAQTNGQTAPPGAYQLVVTAKDGSQSVITPTVTTRETIIGVDLASSNPQVLTASGAHAVSTIRAILSN